MPNIGDKVDHTANLPDELLHEVFSYISLRDKLRVESVSHRFQRCVLKLMKMQPQPLELNTPYLRGWEGPPSNRLNGYLLTEFGNMLIALRSLAKKSKFNDVIIGSSGMNSKREITERMDALFTVLSETDCLDKVVSIRCSYPPNQDIFEKTFAQCAKLSSVTFDFVVYRTGPPNNPNQPPFVAPNSFALDLSRILCNKPLTQLDLKLSGYPQDQLVGLFHSIKPGTLKDLSLLFHEMPPLDLAAMVRELHTTNSWGALQRLTFIWRWAVAHVHLAELFDSFALMPALKKCFIEFDDIQPNNQFVAAMKSLFKSNIKIAVSSEGNSFFGQVPGCQILAQIQKVQNAHPNVFNGYYWPKNGVEDLLYLVTPALDQSFQEEVFPDFCDNAHCVDCHRFYPNVIEALGDAASDCTDMHLEDYQLEKCRIESVEFRLGQLLMYNTDVDQSPLSVETNETEDLVTISLQTSHLPARKFKITLGCVPCFSSSCTRCVNV